jgi:hypothetical protein
MPKVLFEEALPSVAASAAIFANAPEGTARIELTVRVATVVIRRDGKPATTANGQDFKTTTVAPFVFNMDRSRALLVRAIENGGTATGWITYFGG